MWHNIPRERIPWFPTVDEEKCTGCRTCFEFCPHSVYEMKGDAVHVSHPHQCVVGCSNCQALCPQGAISFPDIREVRTLIAGLRKDEPPEEDTPRR